GSARGSATAPGGKTMSMENIQSLSAAYATSGAMYPNERESLENSGGYPKSTMTLGRSTSRSSYTGRSTAIGSTPNITTSGMHHISDSCGDPTVFSTGTSSLRRQFGRCTQTLDSDDRGEVSTCDLQAQLRDLQRENESLRRELDGGRDGKTGYGTNSVNFWSPDVKRDKGSRREEGVRTPALKEQCRVNQEDLQQLPLTVQELQEELRAHRETNTRLRQQRQVPGCDGFSSPPPQDPTEENFFRLQSEHERQANELSLLRKTMEEMEMRIDSQKQTLGARDESIQRLLEMLQGQGLPGKVLSFPHGRQGANMLKLEVHVSRSIFLLFYRASSNRVPPPELHRRNQLQADPAKTRTLQTVIDMKDTKISSLERNIRDLEDEVQMLKTTGLLHPNERQDELKQVEVYKSHSKFMKTKEQTLSPCVSSIRPTPTFLMPTQLPWITEQEEIEQLKQELNRKDSEMQALQTKLETLTNQNSDYKQHIEVLKESLGAKEQRANTLQTEVDALRVRLEEKEQILTKKTKQLQDLSDEKSTLAGEIRDMKDMLDVKERKVNILQKKIENLLEQLKDKDKQLVGLRERVQGLQTDSSNTDTALATLEEALSEKERVIENLRDQKEREERVRLEEMGQMRRENQELKEKLAALQPPKLPQSQQSDLLCLCIHVDTKNSYILKKDFNIQALEACLAIKHRHCVFLKTKEQKKNRFSVVEEKRDPNIADRLRLLEQEVARYREESGKSQAEVERLKGALKDAEVDKSCKEKKITDLERFKSGQLKKCTDENATTKTHLKRMKALKRLNNAKMSLDVAKLRQQNCCILKQELQDAMRETAERIMELEKALRDTMNTSAHREALWAQEEAARVQAQRQLEELMGALEKTRQELDATKVRLSSTQKCLHDRDGHLNQLRQERRKQLEEILEMKQQALLAAISEKDANIALLELSSSKRKKAQEEVMALKREKDRLMHQLKQQTQSRMKLIADNYEEDYIHPQHHPHHLHHMHTANLHHRSLPRGDPHANHRPPMDQDDEEGIWA
uniref:ELKS/RAB6-interacting/CAST family member 2 n=1 Tax=Poecilia formosa TaxID=48698 RepID=A0A087X3K7_POEFO